VGADARRLFLFSMVLGAGILLAADTVTQVISQPVTLPVGAALALLGVPFFLYLVWRRSS
jgi:iron complex transport system permease protein